MRIISVKILKDFWEKHNDIEVPLRAWFKEVENSKWYNPNNIKERYPSASFLEGNRVCFNIKGNKYRLIVKVCYQIQQVYIRFIGTHTEYDSINANKV